MKLNLSTEAVARASANRPWRTIGVWVVLLVVAIGINATLLADALTTEFSFTNDPEYERADRLLEERLRGPRRINEIVIVQSPSESITVDSQDFQDRVVRLHGEILALGKDILVGGTNYYQTGDESLVSADRRTTIMPFVLAGEFDEAVDNVEEVLPIVRKADGEGGFRVLIAGEASSAVESNELATKDIEQGERIGVPFALIILVLLFGAVVAAIIPLLLAIFAIVMALGAAALIGQAYQLVFFVTLMISMIGLAVGIDYSLIVVSRFREELQRGRDKLDAIARTGATAGRTVLFSGITVVVALVGLLIIPTTIYQSLAAGAILVVIAAVIASMTLLPAVLSLLGHRVNALRVPIVGRRLDRQVDATSGGFWGWITQIVMRHPVISLLVTAGLLLAAAFPLLDIKTGFNGVDTFPDGTHTKEAFLLLEKEFSFGVVSPTEIAIDGDVGSKSVQDAIQRLRAALESDPDFVGVPRLEVNAAGDLALLSVPVAGEFSGETAVEAVRRLRSRHIPDAFRGVEADVLVTGLTAGNIEFFDIARRFTPIVFALVLGLSFVLLTVVFRSIVVPIKAILMNLLSVGAAYGLMVLVFHKGVGADLLGFQESEIIDAWIPLFLFSVLFGLSMDYHVFLLSRIRERYDQTKDNAEAVAYGLRSTAGLITGAALIMVAVFSGFASGDLVSNQQVGFGLAVAVFLDATIVRSILVPASMRLLGNANWYLPNFLRWLPDLRVEAEEPVVATASGD